MSSGLLSGDLLKPSIREPGSTSRPGNGPTEAPQSKDVRDALSLFGLNGEPTWKEVKAYTSTVQLYYPDKVAGMGPELREVAESKMKALQCRLLAASASLWRERVIRRRGLCCRLPQCMANELTKPFDVTPKSRMVLVKFAIMLGANVNECCGFCRD